MGDNQRFAVDLEELKRAETGVRDAVGELREIVPWDVGAPDGKGVRGYVDNNAAAAGNEKLETALRTFGEKWEWGVKYLVEDGLETADALAETNENYREAERQAGGFLERLEHFVTGDPVKSYDQARQDGPTAVAAPRNAETLARAGERLGEMTGGQ
ncbi:hypothetical protein [Actinopolyspora mortivallis]|uniref:hypothetical protein n=1 Tax=Actinopolyspora mortivallis TaxID=33906 RepID=UPI002158F917|nr:hypothetical protein [Actinopolyspora mortivallis]